MIIGPWTGRNIGCRYTMRPFEDKDDEKIGFTISLHLGAWEAFMKWMGEAERMVRSYEKYSGSVLYLPRENTFPTPFGFGGSLTVIRAENGNIDLIAKLPIMGQCDDWTLQRVLCTLDRFFQWACFGFHILHPKAHDHVERWQWMLPHVFVGQDPCLKVSVFPVCAKFLRETDQSFLDSLEEWAQQAWNMFGHRPECRVERVSQNNALCFTLNKGDDCRLEYESDSLEMTGGHVLTSRNIDQMTQCFIALSLLAKVFEAADEWWMKKTQNSLNLSAA
jgi:hypothetical protein